jgi:TIR domain
MANSVLVFVSHSSDDKEDYIEPIVQDLEDCYINVWFDKRKILPGNNLRKSIFRDGLDKADIALLFFTKQSLQSSWVDKEIKHVLREESKKGNDFDLNKIISIFDSTETYEAISDRYPELTDDLLHLMPKNYSKNDLGQLISAIWSKYLDLQGGDVENQKQLLAKDKEIFQKEKELLQVSLTLEELRSKKGNDNEDEVFKSYHDSGKLNSFIQNKNDLLSNSAFDPHSYPGSDVANAFGLVEISSGRYFTVSEKGKKFFEWLLLNT